MPCFPVTCTLEKKTFRQIGSQQTCSSLRDEPPLRILPTWSQTSAQYNNHYTCKPCKLKLMEKKREVEEATLDDKYILFPNILSYNLEKYSVPPRSEISY